MDKLLKGNYEVEDQDKITAEKKSEKGAGKTFEDKAMERLGGSIAFVMKENKLVWDEDDEE